MQLRRAVFLSSDRAMYHGAMLRVGRLEHPVARARVVVPALARRQIHRAELPLPQRVVDARLEPPLLLVVADFEPELDQDDAAVDDVASRPAGTTSGTARAVLSVQKPMTYSTPARLYQLRSKITTSPAAGKCCM